MFEIMVIHISSNLTPNISSTSIKHVPKTSPNILTVSQHPSLATGRQLGTFWETLMNLCKPCNTLEKPIPPCKTAVFQNMSTKLCHPWNIRT